MLTKLLAPIKAIKVKHLPILVIYFLIGLMAFDAVTSTFYIKNHTTLSASQLIELSIWISLPWSIKIAFGSVIDNFKLFGSNRKGYIYLGALALVIGEIINILFVSEHSLRSQLGDYTMILLSGLLVTIGVVLCDIIADTLAVELAENTEELGMLQVLSRIAQTLGALLAAAITGYMASNFEPITVFSLRLIFPLIIIAISYKTYIADGPSSSSKDYKGLALAIGFALFCIVVQSQVAVFVAQMLVINYLLWKLAKTMPASQKVAFLIACGAIFLFRLSPETGPGPGWWMIDGLKFDEQFMGHLRLVSAISSVSVLWLLSDWLAKSSIYKSMLALTAVATVFSLPPILVFYGLHEVVGLTAKSVFLVDTGVAAPLGGLAMIPLGILIAKNTPKESKAMYMSLTASFMNMALVGGDLLGRTLNTTFVVTRTDFSQLGLLLIWSLIISTIFSIIGLVMLRRQA